MTTFEPKSYQARAIEKLGNALTKLLTVDGGSDRLVVFKAPTGSGKTLTVGYALSNVHEIPGTKPFVILWLSPADGGLHRQSARSLARILEGTTLDVQLLATRDDVVANATPPSGTLLVASWQGLRKEDADGLWANQMMRDGEKADFFDLLIGITDRGMDLIVVIDESHKNLTATQSAKLMAAISEVRPFIRLEMSATPKTEVNEDLEEDGIHHKVRVRFADVEKEEMVRKSAILNADFADVQKRYPKAQLEQQVLHAAWDRREELRVGYAAEGSAVEPLLLIQYPRGAEADVRAQQVENFLKAKGLVKDETYAIWLTDDHSPDLDKIARYDSPYKALIIKDAVATGWDCPRAQVLVQFRVPGSERFQIQTLGRLMRTPEQKHYDNDDLNIAYVYSDLEGAYVRIGNEDEPDAPLRDLNLKRGSAYPASGLKLKSVFQPRRREYDYPTIESLEPALTKTLTKTVGPLLPKTELKSTSAVILIDAKSTFADIVAANDTELSGDIAEGHRGEEFIQAIYDRVLTSRIGEYRSREQSRSRIKNAMLRWFDQKRKGWSQLGIQHFVVQNAAAVSEAIDAACRKAMKDDEAKAIADARAKRRTNTEWDIPASELVSGEAYVDPGVEGNLVEPSLVPTTRSNPEKRFEKWLGGEHEAGRVAWWWKNGIRNERYLGVEYELPVPDVDDQFTDEICYPDYLLMDGTGTVWAIEVKDINDLGGASGGKTEAKAKGLEKWAAALNKKRKAKTEILDLSPVAACVAVPKDDANGGVIVKRGNPKKWKAPTPENHTAGDGWADLVLGGPEGES